MYDFVSIKLIRGDVMELKITKQWTRIPCEKVVTLFIPNYESVYIESNQIDTAPNSQGILYREQRIPLCSDGFLFIKLSDNSKSEELTITYGNFI